MIFASYPTASPSREKDQADIATACARYRREAARDEDVDVGLKEDVVCDVGALLAVVVELVEMPPAVLRAIEVLFVRLGVLVVPDA